MGGLRIGKMVQNIFTSAKTAALVAVIIIGLSLGWKGSGAAQTSAWWDAWSNGWKPEIAQPGLNAVGAMAVLILLGKAMVGPTFAQTAWTNVTFLGSEVRDPGRNLARALVWGCGIVVTLYVLANLAYIAVLPLDAIAHAPQNRVAVAMMNSIFGSPGAEWMAAAIMISTFGCNNGLILAGARVYFAMARDGLFFRSIATTNRQHVPAAALLLQGVWTAFLTLPRIATQIPSGKVTYSNVYTQLLEYIVSADLVFYILLVAAVMVTAAKKTGRGTALSNAWISVRADHLDRARHAFDHGSGVAGAGHFRHRHRDRFDRNTCLPALAKTGGATQRQPRPLNDGIRIGNTPPFAKADFCPKELSFWTRSAVSDALQAKTVRHRAVAHGVLH